MYKTKEYYEDENCKIRLEELDGHLFVHVKINKASKGIMEKLLKIWAQIKAEAYFSGYEAIYTYSSEDRMFRFFPFAEKLGDMKYRGEKMGVYKWALN